MSFDVQERAQLSLGTSSEVIHRRVTQILLERLTEGSQEPKDLQILDLGCGTGNLKRILDSYLGQHLIKRFVGFDSTRHPGTPADLELFEGDLDKGEIPFPNSMFDVVISIETIEHLENPRKFVREISRICKSGGCVILSTPNQHSLLSKMTFLLKNEFNAFRASSYPAHITALLGIDLVRITTEAKLEKVKIDYSLQGRVPMTGFHFPRCLSRIFPRELSDNIIVSAVRSAEKV